MVHHTSSRPKTALLKKGDTKDDNPRMTWDGRVWKCPHGQQKTKRKCSAGSTVKFLEQAQCSAQARAAAGAPALVGE